jgi:hypothetical protein
MIKKGKKKRFFYNYNYLILLKIALYIQHPENKRMLWFQRSPNKEIKKIIF